MRNAMGLMAGPESPPVPWVNAGRRVLISMPILVIVLISEMASAPDEAAAKAVGRASPLLGESFTITGSVVSRRTAVVTSATVAALAPKTSPPACTFGQETFTSIPATPGTPSSNSAS
ncbi:MAG: hypothetical protein AUH89_00395 [Ktedonobacter sp. 13_1_40CM_4_52_4]|nr:MAG: hypothetical protein AUH89_00395 [Ktedonobacter sp. 13_1_40CM_4_52_4]